MMRKLYPTQKKRKKKTKERRNDYDYKDKIDKHILRQNFLQDTKDFFQNI